MSFAFKVASSPSLHFMKNCLLLTHCFPCRELGFCCCLACPHCSALQNFTGFYSPSARVWHQDIKIKCNGNSLPNREQQKESLDFTEWLMFPQVQLSQMESGTNLEEAGLRCVSKKKVNGYSMWKCEAARGMQLQGHPFDLRSSLWKVSFLTFQYQVHISLQLSPDCLLASKQNICN